VQSAENQLKGGLKKGLKDQPENIKARVGGQKRGEEGCRKEKGKKKKNTLNYEKRGKTLGVASPSSPRNPQTVVIRKNRAGSGNER